MPHARAALAPIPHPTDASLTLAFPYSSRTMPVVRLDRDGVTAALPDAVVLPPLGLPRPARLMNGDALLCEVRFIVRAVVRCDADAMAVILQPSRAGDDTTLWQALRAYQRQHGFAAFVPESRADGAASNVARDYDRSSYCEAALSVRSADDAAFLLAWLEYHFAEIDARTRATLPGTGLATLDTRIVDSDIELRFGYRGAAPGSERAAAVDACRWIASEAKRLFALAVDVLVAERVPASHGAPIGRSEHDGPAAARYRHLK